MLIIDDGSFAVGNSFVTLLEADDYHEQRLTASWIDTSVTDEQKEATLIKAMDYLFVQDWKAGVFDDDIPVRVKNAQIVAAARELASPGVLQEDRESNLKRKRIEGVIDKEYFSGESGGAVELTEIHNLIKPYLIAETTLSSGRRMVRM